MRIFVTVPVLPCTPLFLPGPLKKLTDGLMLMINFVICVSGGERVVSALRGRLRDTVGKTGFFVHGLGDGDVEVFPVVEVCADFLAEVAFGKLDVVLGGAVTQQQVEEVVIDVDLGNVSVWASGRGRTNW
jgi:hypothetical protein